MPLESNPDVMNEFVARLGLDTSKHAFCDIYGLDEVSRHTNSPWILKIVLIGSMSA